MHKIVAILREKILVRGGLRFLQKPVTRGRLRLRQGPKTSTSVECAEGSVFVVPPSKRSQSPIVFGTAQLRRSVLTDSSSDSKPRNFFIIHDQYSI